MRKATREQTADRPFQGAAAVSDRWLLADQRRSGNELMLLYGSRQSAIARPGHAALAGQARRQPVGRRGRAVGELMNVDAVEVYKTALGGRQLQLKAGRGLVHGMVGRTMVPVASGSHAGFVLASDRTATWSCSTS